MSLTKSELIELSNNWWCLHKFYSVLGIDTLINLFKSWQDKKTKTKQLKDTGKNLHLLNKKHSDDMYGDGKPYVALKK
jgi:hypothetical protein